MKPKNRGKKKMYYSHEVGRVVDEGYTSGGAINKEMIAKEVSRIYEPEINRKIVLLFLEKLELLNKEERKELLKAIQLLNYPRFLIK